MKIFTALVLLGLFASAQSQAFVEDVSEITAGGINVYLYSPEEAKWARLLSNQKLTMTSDQSKAEVFIAYAVTVNGNTAYRLFSVSLQRWVSAEESGKKSLRATRPVAKSWETFSIASYGYYNDVFHAQSVPSFYLTAVNGRIVTVQDTGTLIANSEGTGSVVGPIRLALRWALPFNGAGCDTNFDCQSGVCNTDYYNQNNSRSCRASQYSSTGAPCGMTDSRTGYCPQEIGQSCYAWRDCIDVCSYGVCQPLTSNNCIDSESPVTLYNGTVVRASLVAVGDVLLGADGLSNFVTFVANSPLIERDMISINGGDYVFTNGHPFSDGKGCLAVHLTEISAQFCNKLTVGSTIRSFRDGVWSDEVVHSIDSVVRNVSVSHFYTVSEGLSYEYESSGLLSFGGPNFAIMQALMHLTLPRLHKMFDEEMDERGPLYRGVTPLSTFEAHTAARAVQIWSEVAEKNDLGSGEPIYNAEWNELTKTLALQNSHIVGAYHDITAFIVKIAATSSAGSLLSRPPTQENVDILREYGNRILDDLQERLEMSTSCLGIHEHYEMYNSF